MRVPAAFAFWGKFWSKWHTGCLVHGARWPLNHARRHFGWNMKPRTLFHCGLIAALAPLLTGCLVTHAVLDEAGKTTVDTFNPAAVYRKTADDGSLVLEGPQRYGFSQNKGQFGINETNANAASSHQFVIVAPEVLKIAQLQTNQSLSLEDIKKLSLNVESGIKSRSRLPSGYERIAILPKNDVNLGVKQHHPHTFLVILVPAAIVVDIVGFPVEYCYMMTHSQYW